MQIWAHRGASAYAPENTLEAFKKAIELGADGIELDVQLSKDGKVVVIHDETLQRVSNGQGYVRDYTLEELKEFNFSKVMPEYAVTEIPTLREVLQLLKPTGLVLNIELKTGVYFYQGLVEKTIELVERYEMQDRVWYSSFNHYTLKQVKELRPDARCGVLYSDGIYEPAEYASKLGGALHPYHVNLQYPQVMEKCRERGIAVHPWTVNNYSDMVKCVKLGVDAVITNYPDRARLFAKETTVGHYIFDNPFGENAKREFYVFGAGYLGQEFIRRYQGKYIPLAILDNGSSKWGTRVEGIEVQAPSCLHAGDVVIIASIYYMEMIAQLQEMGVTDYYVYDTQNTW